MTSRWRRPVSLVLCITGLSLLAYSAMTHLRAERLRQEVVTAARLPVIDRPERGAPIGVLEIPRLRVCEPVVEGDGRAELDLGVGHLPDTPMPGEPGNTALAGHRDTVFRPLARIRAGDVITMNTSTGRYEYTVRETRIVAPDDLSVLQEEAHPSLTLITCYPFRFIGPAPKRFVVRAERTASSSHRQQDCRDRRGEERPARRGQPGG